MFADIEQSDEVITPLTKKEMETLLLEYDHYKRGWQKEIEYPQQIRGSMN